eukprot:scaffold7739_cov267-Pinguiococcus_pyrenoidosus.AAC.1
MSTFPADVRFYSGEDFSEDGRILQWLVSKPYNATAAGGTCNGKDLISDVDTPTDLMALASTDPNDWTEFMGNGFFKTPRCSDRSYQVGRVAVDFGFEVNGGCCTACALVGQGGYGKALIYWASSTAGSVDFRFAADDAGVFWLNGERIMTDQKCDRATNTILNRDKSKGTVTMQPGWNTIVAKARRHNGPELDDNGFAL